MTLSTSSAETKQWRRGAIVAAFFFFVILIAGAHIALAVISAVLVMLHTWVTIVGNRSNLRRAKKINARRVSINVEAEWEALQQKREVMGRELKKIDERIELLREQMGLDP